MIRRCLVAVVLGFALVPVFPPNIAGACSGPVQELTYDTFEAVAVSHDERMWQFRLDDGTTRAVSISASDPSSRERTSCDVDAPPPRVGGRYDVMAARSGSGSLYILNIAGSFREIAAPPALQGTPADSAADADWLPGVPNWVGLALGAAGATLGLVAISLATARLRRCRRLTTNAERP